MKKLEQFFGKRVLGKGLLRFMECLSARSSTERGKDGRSRLFSRLNGMFSPAGVHNRDARPGRSYIFSAAPKLFGHTLPLRIGGAHPRAHTPRRWGKQHGRTLLEMLGVLAIIGVLSITALVGFTYAMNKHRANETIYDVMLRGTNVPMVDENYASKPSGYEFRFPDLPAGTYYPMTTKKDAGSSYYVEATGVTYRVCEMILKMNPTDIDQIVVNNSVYQGDSDICGNTYGLAMKFCFGEDGTICDGTGHGGSSGGSGSGGSSGGSSGSSGGSGSGSGSGSSGSGTDPDACEGIDCGEHGTCNNGVCDCTDGYSGIDCSIPPDPCADMDCGSHGTCENGSCVCSDGYTGATCQDPPTCTESSDCPSGLVCKDGVCGDPDCTESADCSGDMICQGGLCVPPECTGDSDCADNQQCQGGLCVDIDCDTNPTLPYCICKDSGNYDCCMAPSSSEACVQFCVTHPENCVNDPCPNDENTDAICCAIITGGAGSWENGACQSSCGEGKISCGSGETTWCCDETNTCGSTQGECCKGSTCCGDGFRYYYEEVMGSSSSRNVACCPEGTRSHLASSTILKDSSDIPYDLGWTYGCCAGDITLEYEQSCKNSASSTEDCWSVCGSGNCYSISYTCSTGWIY